MLVLKRNKGENLIIEDQKIIVNILEVKGIQVKLGIFADKSISIHREEIYAKIFKERYGFNYFETKEFLEREFILKMSKK